MSVCSFIDLVTYYSIHTSLRKVTGVCHLELRAAAIAVKFRGALAATASPEVHKLCGRIGDFGNQQLRCTRMMQGERQSNGCFHT